MVHSSATFLPLGEVFTRQARASCTRVLRTAVYMYVVVVVEPFPLVVARSKNSYLH